MCGLGEPRHLIEVCLIGLLLIVNQSVLDVDTSGWLLLFLQNTIDIDAI